MSTKPANTNTREDRVVELLNKLGERMVNAEKERIALKTTLKRYDRLFEVVEQKAHQSERMFLTMQHRLGASQANGQGDESAELTAERDAAQNAAVTALTQRLDRLEQMQSEQGAQINKALSFSRQIEEALIKQDKFNRRMDKIGQDRARLMRKLERIEESVIHTRETLNAKAFVVMTDPEAAAAEQDGKDDNRIKVQIPARAKESSPAAASGKSAFVPFWDKPLVLQAASFAAILLVALGSLYFVMSQPSSVSDSASVRETETARNAATEAIISDSAADEGLALRFPPQPVETANLQQPSVFTMGDDELLAMAENDPDSLAAALNDIVPAAAPAAEDLSPPPAADFAEVRESEQAVAETPAKISQQEAAPQKAEAQAPQTASPAPATPAPLLDEAVITAFLRAQTSSEPLEARIAADGALPPALQQLEREAFAGSAEAQHDLATIYTAGYSDVTPDFARAAEWFRVSAVQGIANARYNLGVMYHQGLGVSQDLDEAISWYRSAALLDHPEAYYNLGIAAIEGIGSPYSPEKAARFFALAAEQGVVEAAFNLGLIYENGLTGEADYAEAARWYEMAAEQGSLEAQRALSRLPSPSGASSNASSNASAGPQDNAAPSRTVVEPGPLRADETGMISPEDSAADLAASGAPTSLAGAPDMTLEIQRELMALGLYPGPADGISNMLTEDAIRTYQRQNNLDVTGIASRDLLMHLRDSASFEYGSRWE